MRVSTKIAGILLIALTGCSTWDEEFEGEVVRAYPKASIHQISRMTDKGLIKEDDDDLVITGEGSTKLKSFKDGEISRGVEDIRRMYMMTYEDASKNLHTFILNRKACGVEGKMKYLENIGKKIDSFFTQTLTPKERSLRDLEEIYHLSDFLPYKWYDDETGLFISEKQIGFVLETMPLVGNSENMQKELSNIFTQILPEESSIQTILYADKNIGGILNEYVKTRDQAIPVMQTLAKRRAKHLSKLAIKSHLHPYVLRDFKCYMSVCINLKSSLKSAIKQVKSIKTQIIATLKVVGVDSRIMNATDLLRFLDGIFNIDFSNTEASEKRWNKFDPINEQVIDPDTDIKIKTEEDLLKVRRMLLYL